MNTVFSAKINGFDWQFIFCPFETDDTFGETQFETWTVLINENFHSKQTLRISLIHEITHAYFYSFGFSALSKELSEETLCEFISMNGDKIFQTAEEILTLYLREKHKQESIESEESLK